MLRTKDGGRILIKKYQVHHGFTEFHGRSLSDKSSRFIDQIPKRSVDTDLKAWQAEENTNIRGRRGGRRGHKGGRRKQWETRQKEEIKQEGQRGDFDE